MVQTKKKEVRDSILDCAYRLFRDKGYIQCSMSEIAREVGISASNIYIYFPSKIHLLYEIYTPLLTSRMMKLANDAHTIDDPEKRLRYIFKCIWQDIPSEDNGFARNLIQAIVTAPADLEKPHDSLKWCEDFLHKLILDCLPEERHFLMQDSMISFLTWMAFDGFTLNVGKNEERNIVALIDHFVEMLMGKSKK